MNDAADGQSAGGDAEPLQPARRIEPPGWMTAAATCAVLRALAAEGARPRFVGGCVRDAVLGLAAKDVDIAVPLRPEEALRLLRAAGIRVVPTGLKHGTVTAIQDGIPFEITALRVDAETFGRHARVAFTGDWRADAGRRDFTINALYAEPDGTVYDPVGGLADLDARVVRFIGDAHRRIAEDALRILRYFRFYARFNPGPPDPDAIAACAVDAGLIERLSGERIREECFGILRTERAAEAMALMQAHGIAVHVLGEAPDLPRLSALVAVEQRHGLAAEPLRRLAAMLSGQEAAHRLRQRLRLSNRDGARLLGLARREPGIVAAAVAPAGPVARRLLQAMGGDGVADQALLAEADGSVADAGPLRKAAAAWRRQVFPLRGADLLARGVPPGPRVGDLLQAIETWWVDGDFRAGREECLAELQRRLAPPAPGHEGGAAGPEDRSP